MTQLEELKIISDNIISKYSNCNHSSLRMNDEHQLALIVQTRLRNRPPIELIKKEIKSCFTISKYGDIEMNDAMITNIIQTFLEKDLTTPYKAKCKYDVN